MGINGWNPIGHEKMVGTLRMRVTRDAGTGKWVAKIDLAGLSVVESIPMNRPGEAMDWADDWVTKRLPVQYLRTDATVNEA